MGALLSQFLNQYAYTDFHELNADWMIKTMVELINQVENFVSLNAIKYADPIQWNITSQYEKNTIVIDPLTGTAYISVAPVPMGVALTNTDYWTVVFDLSMFIVRAAKNFTNKYEADTTTTATFASSQGDWLVWGDVLYEVIVPTINAGDQYVVDSNIRHITMEEICDALAQAIADVDTKVGDLDDLISSDKTSIVNAINSVLTDIGITIGDLNDLVTTDKSSVVNAINEVSDNLTTYIDNTEIANVKDYGAVGDGVENDTSAINDAIATGKIVYFPLGYYLVSSLPATNDNFIGEGVIIYNSHNIPAHKSDNVTLYDSDFASVAAMLSWADNLDSEVVNLYFTNTLSFDTSSLPKLLDKAIVHLYPQNTVDIITVACGIIYLHDPVWNTTSNVYHLLVQKGSECHVVGTDTVKAKTNHFHYWTRENSKLFLNNVSCIVDNNCQFEFFMYAETGSVVTAEGFTWSGTPGTTWGSAFTQGALGEFNVNSWRDFITFFPTSWTDVGNENTKDYMLPFCNVGSIVGSIPDYGWKPFFSETGYDLTGKTFIQADNIPDIYTTLALTGTNIKTTGYVHIQVRRMLENTWDANLGDYEGIDVQIPIGTIQKTVNGGVVNVGGVDYPVTNATVDMDCGVYRTNNSVSACYSGAGNNTIEFQIAFIQYQGLDRPQYIGYISDGAGTKHYFNGVLKNYGRIASARVIFTDPCTQGNANILLNA